MPVRIYENLTRFGNETLGTDVKLCWKLRDDSRMRPDDAAKAKIIWSFHQLQNPRDSRLSMNWQFAKTISCWTHCILCNLIRHIQTRSGMDHHWLHRTSSRPTHIQHILKDWPFGRYRRDYARIQDALSVPHALSQLLTIGNNIPLRYLTCEYTTIKFLLHGLPQCR